MVAGNELALRQASDFMPMLSAAQAVERRDIMVKFIQQVMTKDLDFGKVPGTDKDTLLKPGAEKLNSLFGLTSRLTILDKVEDWTGEHHGGEAFFYYMYRCAMYRGELLIAESDGSCNSHESKYRYRWVKENDLPAGVDQSKLKTRTSMAGEFQFAIDRAETTGKYGKPAEYWERLKSAIKSGVAKRVKRKLKDGREAEAWEVSVTLYRIPNDDIASQVNTIQKMAQKRAYVGATLPATNASEFFTQDVEDMEMIGHVDPVAGGEVIDAQIDEYSQLDQHEEPAVRRTSSGDPDLSHDATFLDEWRKTAAARELSVDMSMEFLYAGLKKLESPLPTTTLKWRTNILKDFSDGKFDAAINKASNGSSNGQASGAGANGEAKKNPAPKPAPKQLDPPASSVPDSLEQKQITHNEFIVALKDQAKKVGIGIAAFSNGLAKTWVALGIVGKEWEITPEQREKLVADVNNRQGHFAKPAE